MPVPTETFWNIKKLNAVFMTAAVLLAVSTVLLVFTDWNYPWRSFQQEALVWDAEMTTVAAQRAMDRQTQQQIDELKARINEIEETLANDPSVEELEAELAQAQRERAPLVLPAATEKGRITPLVQARERAILTYGRDSEEVKRLSKQLTDVQAAYDELNSRIVAVEAKIASTEGELREKRAKRIELQRELESVTRTYDSALERLAKVEPSGAAKIGHLIRNAPLMDWFNPSEKVQQVVVTDVRTDLNFLTVETIDRCQTCHINIDDKRFEQGAFIAFVERQIASAEGQDVDRIKGSPVVDLGFWLHALREASPLAEAKIKAADERAIASLTALSQAARTAAPTSHDELLAEFEKIKSRGDSKADDAVVVTRAQWYAVLSHYQEDLREAVRKAVDKQDYKNLTELYRFTLVDRLNVHRRKEGHAELSPSRVLLAHPKLDLYVEAESKHPMKTMGCTSCHEGSGQETRFEFTAHTPREIWVDAKTGSPLPDFLVSKPVHGQGHGPAHAGKPSTFTLDGATVAYAAEDQAHTTGETDASPVAAHEPHAAAAHDAVVTTHFDLNITDPHDPAPFAPRPDVHGSARYAHPADEAERKAVRQVEYWTNEFGWEHVHYMHWEKPMNSLEYTESSCNKCHTEVFDIKDEAPRLFEGRHLFASLGCVNCHSVEDLKDDMDIKKVGPSLVHVSHKLSPQMMSSWIWAPKAFRPTTRMPHYFMLENNSSPVDILRTRTEAAAMAYYLKHTPPPKSASASQEYSPATPPSEPGDAAKGKALFNSLGCLSCHSHLDEHGKEWIVGDLIDRRGLDKAAAEGQYEAMSFNQRHTYATEHLDHKLSHVGPELSGVGTKLKAGRDLSEARAWTYDWLLNPRHYSSYTIMPSFRLSEAEANDLAAYLLSLERPGYTPDSFGYGEDGTPKLDDEQSAMLNQLVASLKRSQMTAAAAEAETNAMSVEDRLSFLGNKMISHYGCSGCHAINGFENATSACTNLDDWGLKDPHKLDFGYFDHAFDKQREKPRTVWKVKHEGLEADAPQVKASLAGVSDKVHQVTVEWETVDLERRPWLYHKLHNTRVYDRARTSLDGSLSKEEGIDIGKPYDKLKMPKFFLKDEQVQALVTYVTSIRKPLVSKEIQAKATPPQKMAIARGRQVATLYNCYACHNVENNDVLLQQYYPLRDENGKLVGDTAAVVPPRLMGQGARTQPDWLFYFLHNVHPLRRQPAGGRHLDVRMPSFFHGDEIGRDHASALTDYFAAHSNHLSEQLGTWIAAVDTFRQNSPDAAWFDAPSLAPVVAKLRTFALRSDLVDQPALLDEQLTPSVEERRPAWNRLLASARFLSELWHVEYPFQPTPRPKPDAERFARGQALFNELRCVQCHSLGEEDKLLAIWKMDNPDAGKAPAPATEEDDPYGESAPAPNAPAAADAEADPYGEGDAEADPYGEEPSEAAPLGPVYSAPNLAYTARRLQWQWVDHWLQEPNTMMPATKMPQWFAGWVDHWFAVTDAQKGKEGFTGGGSAFAKYPPAIRAEKEALFGYTGAEQRALLMDFIYAAGLRNYTPGAERLTGQQAPAIELKPLAPPPRPATPDGGEAQPGDAAVPSKPAPAAPEPPKPVVEPTASAIELHEGVVDAPGGKTRVVGVVKFGGARPRRSIVRMDADRFCASAHKTPVRTEQEIVTASGEMQNVLVYVENAPAGGKPAEPAVIDQHGCKYVPHVSAVVAGQKVRILNSDPTLHNVKMTSSANGSFNEGMPVMGMVLEKTFNKPEFGMKLACDVHPWMGAVVHVIEHPYFAVSDVEGRFEITDLPPGKYTLVARHQLDKYAPVKFEVEVTEGKSTRTDVTVK